MSESASRQQQLYWNQMIELKVATEYFRLYRDSVGRLVTAFGIVKAVASSGSIGAWVIWRSYAFLWGLIIAISQVLDALKDVFPFSKIHKATSEHAIALDSLFIDAQLEWDNIASGRYSDEQIANRLHKLRRLQHDANRHSFPSGLATKAQLFIEAQTHADAYFKSMYDVDW